MSVIVGNPGGIPEVSAMGGGLARAGMLRALVVPFGETMGGLVGATQRLPDFVSVRVRCELARRRLPEAIPPNVILYEASLQEAIFVASQRCKAPRSICDALAFHRNHVFDGKVSRHISRNDSAVVSTWGAALSTLKRARDLGVASFLHYPIAHHAFAQRILREEAILQPAYAPTLQFHDLPTRFRERLEAEIEAADRIFVLSSLAARTFEETGVDPGKLVITPLGVDLEMFRPTVRRAERTFRIVFVGQIGQRKGLSYLLDALRFSNIPRAELLLVGNVVGTDRTWRGLSNVRHIPHVPRDSLRDLYACADVFVLPSLVEGFPHTAMEAMACGLPVILSENTFGHDVVTHGEDGYVVPIRDAEAIAEYLRYLHREPDARARVGAAARRRAEDFSWDQFGERVSKAIKSVGDSSST